MHTRMWLAPGLFAMAAALASPGEDGWPNAGYPGFSNSIDALVGPTNLVCESVRLDRNSLELDSQDCKPKSEGKLSAP